MRAGTGLFVAAALQTLFVISLRMPIYDIRGIVAEQVVGHFFFLLAVLLVVGSPLYFLLQKFRKAGFISYVSSGWCVGICPWLLARAIESARIGESPWHAFRVSADRAYFDVTSYLIDGTSGVLAALVFLVIVRPDVRVIRL